MVAPALPDRHTGMALCASGAMRVFFGLLLLLPGIAGCTPFIPVKDDFGTSALVPVGDIPPEFAEFNAYDPGVNPLLADQICATPYQPLEDKSVGAARPHGLGAAAAAGTTSRCSATARLAAITRGYLGRRRVFAASGMLAALGQQRCRNRRSCAAGRVRSGVCGSQLEQRSWPARCRGSAGSGRRPAAAGARSSSASRSAR